MHLLAVAASLKYHQPKQIGHIRAHIIYPNVNMLSNMVHLPYLLLSTYQLLEEIDSPNNYAIYLVASAGHFLSLKKKNQDGIQSVRNNLFIALSAAENMRDRSVCFYRHTSFRLSQLL